MRRMVVALGLIFLGLIPAKADDKGPELTAPVATVSPFDAPGELPGPLDAKPLPVRETDATQGPLLVVPGVNVPRSGTRVRSGVLRPPLEPMPSGESSSPPLVGPSEMNESPFSTRSSARPVDPRTGSRSGRPPITLDSEPAGSDVSRNPADARTFPTTRRNQGLFGRFFPGSPFDRGVPDDRDVIKVEPRTDPAADAALKRRVETQIRESIASRLRTYEVRVVGREITIVARPARFWQRRSVKNAIEALPSLNGHKAIVEVVD